MTTKGFTLIELIVVIGIIGILAAVGIPSYTGHLKSARDKDAQTALRTLAAAQETYRLVSGNYFVSSGTAATSSTSCASCCTANLANSSTMASTILKNTLNTNYYYYCAYGNNTVTPPTFTVRAQNISGTINFYINESGITSATGWSAASF